MTTASEPWLNEMEQRLRTLHSRDCLVGAGVVDEAGHVSRGDRTDTPLSEEFIQGFLNQYKEANGS